MPCTLKQPHSGQAMRGALFRLFDNTGHSRTGSASKLHALSGPCDRNSASPASTPVGLAFASPRHRRLLRDSTNHRQAHWRGNRAPLRGPWRSVSSNHDGLTQPGITMVRSDIFRYPCAHMRQAGVPQHIKASNDMTRDEVTRPY